MVPFEHAEEDSDDEVIGEGNLMDEGRTSQGESDIPQILNDEDMPGGDMLFSLAHEEGYKRPSMAQERRDTFSKLRQIDTKLVSGR